jgi:hypothetical protein
MIMISFGAVVAYGWNRDHRAVPMAEAVVVMADRAGDQPADAHVLLRADYKQCGSGGFGHQDGPRLARKELQSPSELRLEGGRIRPRPGLCRRDLRDGAEVPSPRGRRACISNLARPLFGGLRVPHITSRPGVSGGKTGHAE